MAIEELATVEYRGFRLCWRLVTTSGCDRILRPDGTWGYSPPTLVGGDYEEWAVKRRTADGWEVVATALTEAEARGIVDRLDPGSGHA
jgi:hypothetical protein